MMRLEQDTRLDGWIATRDERVRQQERDRILALLDGHAIRSAVACAIHETYDWLSGDSAAEVLAEVKRQIGGAA